MTRYRNRVLTTLSAVMAVVFVLVGCQGPSKHLQRSHGIRYYETGLLSLAEARLAGVVEKDTTDWKAMYYLGLVRLKQNRPLDAELLLERAYRIRQDGVETPDILDALAEAMHKQHKNNAKLYAILDGATQRYGQVRDYVRQGKYFGLSGDADAAQLAFQKSYQLAEADDPTPYVAAADFYESIGDVPQAKTALRRAYWIQPGDPMVNERLRRHGEIPGPTAGVQPPRNQANQ